MAPSRSTRNNVKVNNELQPTTTTLGLQENETLVSNLSVAALPPRYSIWVAVKPSEARLGVEEEGKRWTEAEELLSDAWRREDVQEGRLGDLHIIARKRRKIALDEAETLLSQGLESVKAESAEWSSNRDGDVLWYTADLRFPCSCKQSKWAYGFKPRHSPPLNSQLHPLPSHLTSEDIPPIGSYIADWSMEVGKELDANMSELPSFESEWKGADGSWGRGWIFDEDIQYSTSLPIPPPGLTSPQPCNDAPKSRWKGKGRAVDSIPPPPSTAPPASQPIPQSDLHGRTPLLDTIIPDDKHDMVLSWQEESKRRKEQWRNLIKGDKGRRYGRIWEIVPLPHTYPTLIPGQSEHPSINLSPLPGDYKLPKSVLSNSSKHPYHPDIHRYIRKNSRGRVYWLIPIHGPVTIPHWNDLFALPSHREAVDQVLSKQIPVPSPAELSDNISTPPSKKLNWTPALFLHFLNDFLIPLYRDPSQPLGSISITLSGPKPDPWIDLVSKPPLQDHLFIKHTKSIDKAGGPIAPTRVEAGDHIRIYCDAKYALALRTWLFGIEYDTNKVTYGLNAKGDGGGSSGIQEGERSEKGIMVKLFHKTRLALIGSRQEILTVA